RGNEAEEDVHQGRLPGAVLAEERDDLPRLHVEVDAVVGDDVEEAAGDPPHPDGRSWAGPPGGPGGSPSPPAPGRERGGGREGVNRSWASTRPPGPGTGRPRSRPRASSPARARPWGASSPTRAGGPAWRRPSASSSTRRSPSPRSCPSGPTPPRT